MDYGEAFSWFIHNDICVALLISAAIVVPTFILLNRFLDKWSKKRFKTPIQNTQEEMPNAVIAQPAAAGPEAPAAPAAPPPNEPARLYNAMVFAEDGIKFKAIPEKLTTQIYCDPSMPKSGQKLLAVEDAAGKHQAFDPRDAPLVSKESPQRAWRATHVYELVKAVWSVPLAFLEKLNMVFMWVFCGAMVFLVIVIISKIGGD